MPSKIFLLVLTSVLSLAAVLVFYIATSKTKPKALKISRKEDVGFHSIEIPPIPERRLTHGELFVFPLTNAQRDLTKVKMSSNGSANVILGDSGAASLFEGQSRRMGKCET